MSARTAACFRQSSNIFSQYGQLFLTPMHMEVAMQLA